MVTPGKIAGFVGTVLMLLLVISLFFPESKQRVGDSVILKFPSISDIFAPEKIIYADISDLIEESEHIEENLAKREKTPIRSQKQSKSIKSKSNYKLDTVRADAKSLLKKTRQIEFPVNGKKVLDPFFRELQKVHQLDKPIRIMHYGDSQIEGDRITSFVRDRLQRKFGGNGAGLLPVVQPYGQFSMKQDVSSNWNRYTIFGKKDTTLFHNRYGVMASFCRFTPHDEAKESRSFEAWMKMQKSALGYNTVKKYDCFKIYYGYNKKPFLTQVYKGEEMVFADFIPVANGLKVLEWSFDSTPEEITVQLKGDDSPDFYGVSFESKTGILVDNIAMRGSSGLIFTKMDKKLMKEMYDKLNVKLLILQYGGNVVPYLKGSAESYGKLFYKQLIRLKTLIPGIPIIVIGPADMSVKEQDYYTTYPVLPKVRDALKNATFKAGFAYWDMYEAMGGKNSMPSWVFAEPSLASSDFVHFNHRGARLIAEMFYNALMYEYDKYCIENAVGKFASIE